MDFVSIRDVNRVGSRGPCITGVIPSARGPTALSEATLLRALKGLAAEAQRLSRSGLDPLVVLRTVTSSSPLAVLVADDIGRYVLANAQASVLTGYSLAELRRMSVWDLTSNADKQEFETLWRAFREQRHQRGQYELERKTGRSIGVEYVAQSNVLPHFHMAILRRRMRPKAQSRKRS